MTTDSTAVEHISSRRLAWWIPPLMVLTSAAGIYVLRSRATVECNIGINAGMAMIGALLALPFWSLAVWGVTEVVRRLLPRPVAIALILLLLWVASSLVLGWLGAPDGYPSDSPTCSDNVPHWWPGWLPT